LRIFFRPTQNPGKQPVTLEKAFYRI
jgi:hypothetical protein